jgi:hypothetical protein
VRVYRDRQPGTLRITIVRGRSERDVGPRGLLTIQETAAFMRRSAAVVRRSIAAGLLPARRRGREFVLTVAACDRYLREEAEDRAAIRARRWQRRIPGEEVHATLGL